jgi:hypothetical protein
LFEREEVLVSSVDLILYWAKASLRARGEKGYKVIIDIVKKKKSIGQFGLIVHLSSYSLLEVPESMATPPRHPQTSQQRACPRGPQMGDATISLPAALYVDLCYKAVLSHMKLSRGMNWLAEQAVSILF